MLGNRFQYMGFIMAFPQHSSWFLCCSGEGVWCTELTPDRAISLKSSFTFQTWFSIFENHPSIYKHKNKKGSHKSYLVGKTNEDRRITYWSASGSWTNIFSRASVFFVCRSLAFSCGEFSSSSLPAILRLWIIKWEGTRQVLVKWHCHNITR